MRVPRLSPAQYRRVTVVAAVLLGAIIVTGGAVRLTGSGLGCPDWPNCEPGRLTPYTANDFHAMVEFVNRTVTGLVSVAVIVAVLGSLVRAPRRTDLLLLSLGLVAGVVVQIVLGALVVQKLLSPPWVMTHFLVSMLLLANAVVLCRRAGQPDASFARRPVPIVAPSVVWMSRVLVVAASVVVVTGTVVTGSGPHSGDVPGTAQRATRLDLYIPDVARVHGTSAMVLLASVLVTPVARPPHAIPAPGRAPAGGAARRPRRAGRSGVHAVLHRHPRVCSSASTSPGPLHCGRRPSGSPSASPNARVMPMR